MGTSKRSFIPTNPYDYAYATGRVRALETKLMDQNRTLRLFDAKTIDDIIRVLLDSGYTIPDSVEEGIKRHMIECYELVTSIIPNKEYVDAMLLLHDHHNLKVILKAFLNTTPSKLGLFDSDIGELSDLEQTAFDSKEFLQNAIASNFAFPSKQDPIKLFEMIRDQKQNDLDVTYQLTIKKALKEYRRTSNPGEIDMVIDQDYFARLNEMAILMNNPFFSDYCKFRIDSTNLAILLRTRALKAGGSSMSRSLLGGGRISKQIVQSLYTAPPEQIKKAYTGNLCEKLTEFAKDYGQDKRTLEFGRQLDNILIGLIKKTKNILFGPEVLIAYIIANEIQTKNITIALTCIRNQIPMSLAREMMRDTF